MTEKQINFNYAKSRIKKVVFDLYDEGISVSVVDDALGEITYYILEVQCEYRTRK